MLAEAEALVGGDQVEFVDLALEGTADPGRTIGAVADRLAVELEEIDQIAEELERRTLSRPTTSPRRGGGSSSRGAGEE